MDDHSWEKNLRKVAEGSHNLFLLPVCNIRGGRKRRHKKSNPVQNFTNEEVREIQKNEERSNLEKGVNCERVNMFGGG